MIKSFWHKYKESDIFKKISAAFILKVIGTLSAVILYITISRLYGAETMGSYSLFIALLTLFGIFSTLGLTSAIMRFVPDYLANQEFHELHRFKNIAFILVGFISIFLGLVLFSLAIPLSEKIFYNHNNAWILELISVILPFYALFLIGNEFARAMGKTTVFEYFRSIHIQFIGLVLLLILKWTFDTESLPVYITAGLYVLAFGLIWTINHKILLDYKPEKSQQPTINLKKTTV